MTKNNRYVVHHGNEWAVKGPHAQRASGVYTTQGSAEEAARVIVRNHGGGQVLIQDRHGQWRHSGTVGRGH